MGLIKDKFFGVQIPHPPINIIFPFAILDFWMRSFNFPPSLCLFPFSECVELGYGGVWKAMNTVKFHVVLECRDIFCV